MLSAIMAQVDEVLAAATPQEAGARFFAAMQPLRASYCQVRLYRRPEGALTSAKHFTAGGRVFAYAPAGWLTSEAGRYVCFENNPLLQPIREHRTRYRFGDFAPRDNAEFGAYWDALGEAGIGEALCATSYGCGRAIASVHLGIRDPHVSEREAFALQMAGLVLTERLLQFDAGPGADAPALTVRERDALALVAEGKTDWEISVILGVSEATARFHVDNARRKLGAVNRAQAVAKMAALNLL